IRVSVDDVGLSRIACSQHAVIVHRDESQLKIELASGRERLNRDFVLRYAFQSQDLSPTLLVDDEHFLLTVTSRRTGGAAQSAGGIT
ncbi:hypothetical protein, partial [Mammaliicoccus sciuri]|uniref:hypothetical protein n=1 Tax=Mammaliicoccus sciuri TaxID=1296 RepID=UPI0031FEC5B0